MAKSRVELSDTKRQVIARLFRYTSRTTNLASSSSTTRECIPATHMAATHRSTCMHRILIRGLRLAGQASGAAVDSETKIAELEASLTEVNTKMGVLAEALQVLQGISDQRALAAPGANTLSQTLYGRGYTHQIGA